MTTNGKPQAIPAPFQPQGPMPALSGAVDAAQVMLRYQDLMQQFLETQHSLMSSFLSGLNGSDPGLSLPLTKFEEGNAHHPTRIVGQAIPSPEGTPADAPTGEPKAVADPAQAPAVQYDRDRLTNRLLELVSQRHRVSEGHARP